MKLSIEGKNGKIELCNRYLFLTIGTEKDNVNEEHIIMYEEIEDIIYKKPTKDNYGFLSLYLFTKSYILNKKMKYTLILDKTNEKDLDNNKKIFNFIKGIVSKNNDIKVREEKINEKITNEEKADYKNEQVVEDITEEIKEELVKIIVDTDEEIEEETKIETVKPIIKIVKDNIVSNNENIINFINDDNKQKIEKNNESEKEIEITTNNNQVVEEENKEEIIVLPEKNIENKTEEIEEEKINLDKVEQLEKKLDELEKELKEITYKELILNKYIDETKDRKKVDKLIIELKKLIEKLEKIKKEIGNNENILNNYSFLRLKNGNIVIKNINKYLDNTDKEKIEDYIRIYEKINLKYDEIKKETDILLNETNDKKNKLMISDDDYEKDINLFKGVKTNKEFITKYRKEAQENVNKIKKEIEKTVDPQVKYKFVRKGISEQTKMLAAFSTLNTLRRGRSRFSTMALSVLTGTFALHDLLGYDLKKVEYNEVTIKESIIGIESVDTEKAKNMITYSKNEIDKILYDCQKKYSEYPKFNDLKKNLLNLKNDIEKEELELQKVEDKLTEYKMQPRVKVLKYKE